MSSNAASSTTAKKPAPKTDAEHMEHLMKKMMEWQAATQQTMAEHNKLYSKVMSGGYDDDDKKDDKVKK